MSSLSRRTFLGRTPLLSAALALPFLRSRAAAPPRRWRAAIIGSTGRGNYGHELDLAFQHFPEVEVVAVADPDPEGRARAAERTQARLQYSDYREMLDKERPELVVIAPRWSRERHAMALTALNVNAHLLCEKPLTTTLAEADEILATAKNQNRKIAVAHQMRLAPNVVHLKQNSDLLGDLLHLRSWGKQDARAGGEDLLVLGTHLFDMMRLFTGDASSCQALVLQNGRGLSLTDAREASEQIGPIAGDEIEAQFAFSNGATASFTSRRRLRETLGPWALELFGSKGAARIDMDVDPVVRQRIRRPAEAQATIDEWRSLSDDPSLAPAGPRGFGPANARVVTDWLNAIEHDREPECSGLNAMKSLEMVMAIYQAALQNERVKLPLEYRDHPLRVRL